MHELGIAQEIVNSIGRESVRRGGARIYAAGLRIGELAGVNVEALRFSFEAIVHDTELEHLSLEIETCPHRRRCIQCKKEFAVTDYDLHCPQCSSEEGDCIGGDELDLSYLEVEEHATSGVGAESTE